jgi:CDP-diacylglycerol--glycerol-3-phosphate 3-phosphatidyltransferase
VIKEKFGSELDKWIQSSVPFLFRRPINPNLLTVTGTAVCVGGAVAYGQGALALGSFLLGLGGIFDLLDGVVARHFGTSSAFGAFLDSTLDRFVDMAIMLGLVIHYAGNGQVATAMIAGIALIASVLTSYTRARAESLVLNMPGGIVERGERVGLLIAGGLFGLMVPVLWILAAGASATVVQRFMAAHRAMRELEAAEGAQRDARGDGRFVHGE